MNNNKFLDGVLWGLLIGGVGVFLFGTKKGNKILKAITQEGASGLNKVLEDIESVVEDAQDETSPENSKAEKKEINTFSDNHFEDISEIREKPKAKRFFKSSKK